MYTRGVLKHEDGDTGHKALVPGVNLIFPLRLYALYHRASVL